MLGGDAPAVFILGRVICDGTVHACNLDANFAPFDADTLPAPCQRLASFVPATNTERRSLAEDELRQFATLTSPEAVQKLRFLCGLSPRMTECCWYETNFATLCRYGANRVTNIVHDAEADLERLLQSSR